MKIVVIGGTGLVGSKLVARLTEQGHEAVAASRRTGVNAVTGAGLAEVLRGATVVVDVASSASFGDRAVMDFFSTSTANLLAAEAVAGVRHHVALSVVGLERLPHNGYFRAKLAQERLIKASSILSSIVRSTQFFEFISTIADASSNPDGLSVHLPPMLFAGVRFVIAGLLLAGIVLATGDRLPRRLRDWRINAIVGLFLLLGGNAVVVWAEQHVESGAASVFVAAVPLWAAFFDALWPGGTTVFTWRVGGGLLLGFLGSALLAGVTPGELMTTNLVYNF